MGRNLGTIRYVLEGFQRPQDAVPSVLIAGTNGKGSTAAMVDAIVRAAGYRTGLFHSPALGPDHEHIHVNGRPIGAEAFAERFLRVDDDSLTWFEALTATAFLSFAEEQVDLAVVEVGMGGTSDCTNVIAAPRVSAIVSIAMDHAQYLGRDAAAVARNKCGIFRPGQPALLGPVSPEVEAVVTQEAQRTGAELLRSEWNVIHRPLDLGQRLTLSLADGPLDLTLPLAGRHQAENAAVAVRIVEVLAHSTLPGIDRQAIVHGLEHCRWPARLEWIQARRPVLLDAAHNPAAISALVGYVESRGLAPTELIFGAFQDKDCRAMLRALEPIVGRLTLTSTGHHRSAPATRLAELCPRLDSITVEPCLSQALTRALNQGTGPLCITGSLELVGKARELLMS